MSFRGTQRPVDNTRPIDVEVWKFGENDPYLRGFKIENIGSKNDKLRGDVFIGWFKPLYDYSWVVGFIVAFVLYWVLMVVFPARRQEPTPAAAPAT